MRIYVTNLSYQVSADDLRAAFITFRNVGSIFIVKDRATGKSKGFGYVDISPDSEAKAAIDLLTGKMLLGRPMALKVALPPREMKKNTAPLPPPRTYDSRDTHPGGPKDRGAGSRAPSGKDRQTRSSENTRQERTGKMRIPAGKAPGRRAGQGRGRRH